MGLNHDSFYTDVADIFPDWRKGYRDQEALIRSSGFRSVPDRFDAEDVKRSSEAPIRWIPVDKLIAGQSDVRTEDVEKYKEDLLAGAKFPPIIAIALADGRYMVWNGHHRASAHILAGKKRIKARVYFPPVAEV